MIIPIVNLNKIAAHWSVKTAAQFFSINNKNSGNKVLNSRQKSNLKNRYY